jgi:hypothetical protein
VDSVDLWFCISPTMVQLTGKEKNNNSIFHSLMDSNGNRDKGTTTPPVFKPQVRRKISEQIKN